MAETGLIKVKSYHEPSFRGSWGYRSSTMWGLGALGFVVGGIMGAVAPLFPMIAGFTPTLAQIGTSITIFAAAGMATGAGGGALVGTSSGAASAAAKEQERRMRERDIKLGLTTPELEAALDRQEEKPDTRNFGEKAKDFLDSYFNPRVGALFTLFGMAAGAVMAAGYFAIGGGEALPGMDKLLGAGAITSNPAAVTAYFVGVMGSFGALWNFAMGKIAHDVQQVAYDLISGKTLGKEWGPQRAPEPQVAPQRAPELEILETQSPPSRYGSFENMLVQRGQDKGVSLTLQP